MIRVLHIESNLNDSVLFQTFIPADFIVTTVRSFQEALEMIDDGEFDLIAAGTIVDVHSCIKIIRKTSRYFAQPPIVCLTRNPDTKAGVKLLKEGVLDYLIIPDDLERLQETFRLILGGVLCSGRYEILNSSGKKIDRLTGKSQAIKKLKLDIMKLAKFPAPVLITGESGTGKELVAGLIHDYSLRARKKFHALNAGAIPSGICGTELFGSEPGAFTGAVKRKGCFEHANKGSLFLDEIGELDVSLQVEFLRTLETKTIKRIGGNNEIPVDVRLICATNRNLDEEVKKGNFRLDLLHRIKVLILHIPPLRDRIEDIPDLVECFLSEISDDLQLNVIMSDSGYEVLFNYDWPGNIRELYNVILRSACSAEKEKISAADIIF